MMQESARMKTYVHIWKHLFEDMKFNQAELISSKVQHIMYYFLIILNEFFIK